MPSIQSEEDATLAQELKSQLQMAAGFEGDPQAQDIAKALDYYFQRPRGDEVTGKSQVVSGDLSAMVEAVLSQSLDAFSSDNIVELDSFGPDDEWQCQLESDTVTHFVMKKADGFVKFSQGIKDALLKRLGVLKVYVQEDIRTKIGEYENVEPEALVNVANPPPGLDIKVLDYNAEKKTLRAKITQTKQKFCIDAVETFYYPRDWNGQDIQELPFCGERHVDTRSKLISMGFPKGKVNRLKAYGRNTNNTSEMAANLRGGTTPIVKTSDKSQDLVEWFELYTVRDTNGDGIGELERVAMSYANTLILQREPVDFIPYAAGSAILNPHRLTGISLYDKLRVVQDVNTGLDRALLDNVNTVTKQRLAYLDGKVNEDDVSDGRTNGSLRVRASVGDIRTALMPFEVPDQSAGIIAAKQTFTQKRTELGGAALELASGNAQIGGDRMGSQGLDRAYSVMEQLSAMMTKTLAATLIKQTFLLAHATLRRYYTTPTNIKKNGKWFTAVPSQWQPREGATVKVGMSPGERARRAAAMWQMLTAQIQLAQSGMDEVLVNLNGFYALLLDWARVVDVPNAERYWVDPDSQESQQAKQMKVQSAQQQQKERKALMQKAVQLQEMNIGLDKYQGDADRQFKYYDANLKAETEEAKIAGDATVKLITSRNKDGKSKGRSKTDSEEQSSSDAA